MEAGERELGFYLLDLKRRKLYKDGTCTTFNEFIRGKTGLTKKKVADLVRVSRALELLPLMNEAFNQGRLYRTAVRAMAAVATAQTEAEWIAYARGHRVEEVERKVASSKAGEGPDDDRWGRRPVRYPYHFTVSAEVHQAYESLTAVLSLRLGKELTVDEALFIAARDRIAAEIEKDGKDGEERKLPSAYRLVLKECPLCEEICVPTADGPVAIPRERAEKLLQGAEVLDLTKGQGEEAKATTN